MDGLLDDGVRHFLHVDRHLVEFAATYGVWIYALLFLIIFFETGVVVTPFLPGDSLLFATGALAAAGVMDIGLILTLLTAAAIIGDNTNYFIGRAVGPRVFTEHSRWLKREHLLRTQRFYEVHGGKTVVLARFVPIIRTFAPFVAGVGRMHYPRFLAFDVGGGILWVWSFGLLGYFFGNTPDHQGELRARDHRRDRDLAAAARLRVLASAAQQRSLEPMSAARMSLGAVTLGALALAIVVSCISRLNVGLLALALAWIIGVFVGGLRLPDVFAGFPIDLFLTLSGVTLLFAQAHVNGTLDIVAHNAIRLCRGRVGVVPIMYFGLGAVLASAGPGNIATTGLLAPMAMATALRMRISPFLMAIMVGNGANSGSLSPFAPTGIIVTDNMTRIGLRGLRAADLGLQLARARDRGVRGLLRVRRAEAADARRARRARGRARETPRLAPDRDARRDRAVDRRRDPLRPLGFPHRHGGIRGRRAALAVARGR